MHLLLVSGFLGSGKTTLVIKLVDAALARGKKVAILVNEIGEIGIDNQLMRQLDLNVWELLKGCICCTLAADLVTTLEQLANEYQPDLVLIEPSGAADPRNVLKALPYYHGPPFESQRTVALLDPLRLPMLMEVMTPLITAHIERADLILIGKKDLASSAELQSAREAAQEINSAAPVIEADLQQNLDSQLLNNLLPWKS